MKIITKGNLKWWIGVNVHCKRCGTTSEVEENDPLFALSKHPQSSHQYVLVTCPLCEGELEAKNPNYYKKI